MIDNNINNNNNYDGWQKLYLSKYDEKVYFV